MCSYGKMCERVCTKTFFNHSYPCRYTFVFRLSLESSSLESDDIFWTTLTRFNFTPNLQDVVGHLNYPHTFVETDGTSCRSSRYLI